MPRRELPRTYRARIATHPAPNLRRRWRRLVGHLVGEVSDLYSTVQVYRDLVEVVQANPATLQPPVFFNWARQVYVVTICVGLRRLADAGADVISLGRLLREVELRPDVVSRRAYRAIARLRGIPGHYAGVSSGRPGYPTDRGIVCRAITDRRESWRIHTPAASLLMATPVVGAARSRLGSSGAA